MAGTPTRGRPNYRILPEAEQQRLVGLEHQQRSIQISVNERQRNGKVMIRTLSDGGHRNVSPLDAVRAIMKGEAELAD